MKGLIEELKYNFKQKGNGLMQLILINVIVYILLAILFVITKISDTTFVFDFIHKQFSLPAPFNEFITRPWTLFTYFFTHDLSGILHILMNMLVLYWFGKLVTEYLGNRRLINLYLLGGISGGVLYLILFNTVPFFIKNTAPGGMVGASASVYAVVVGIATLIPNYTISLLLLGPVRIKFIAAFLVFLSFLLSVQGNYGGNVAHLGGALMGFIYVSQLRKGIDLGKPFNYIAAKIASGGRSTLKVTYRKKDGKKPDQPDQTEIDSILDKINKSGWQSLTKAEKEKLYKASNKQP